MELLKKIFKKEMIVDSNLPDVRKIEIPDLKQYMINGYKEIREVKKANEELINKLEEAKKFEKLYEATLVTLKEFEERDKENKTNIGNLYIRINTKNDEIKQLNDLINTYKIREIEVNKREDKLDKTLKETKKAVLNEYKNKIINKILNTKGNISKNRICDMIDKEN